MDGVWTALAPFLIAAGDPLPERLFTGYGFCGVDFVAGPEGLERFEAAGRGQFEDGEDGCYALARRGPSGFSIGTDAAGQCRLYLYRSGRRWAVANSFALLVDRVIAEGWTCTTDPALMDSWGGHHRCLYTAPAYSTAVREIALLPAASRVVLDGAGRAQVVPRQPRADDRADSLGRAVERFMEVWLERLLALATAPGLDLRVEVSGGIDSRAVLALLLHLRGRGLVAGFDRIGLVSPVRPEADHAVARQLADAYGFRLNAGPAGVGIAQDAAARYAAWRLYALGGYGAPAVTGPAFVFPHRLVMGGHAGEFHRKYSMTPEIDEVLMANSAFIRTRRRLARLQVAIEQAAAVQAAAMARPRSRDFAWFRAMRLRLHHTFRSQIELRSSPLGGRHLDACDRFLSDADFDAGRLHTELMQRLVPGLAAHPYDTPDKAPRPDALAAAGGPVPRPEGRGAVFLSNLPGPGTAREPGTDAATMARILDDFAAARDALLPGCLTPAVLAEADATAATLRAGGTPTRPGIAMLHAVILSGLIARTRPSLRERARRPLAAAGDRLAQGAKLTAAALRRS